MNATSDRETRTYRGRTLEEVLPKIKADLGPDALIVRQRDGLTGGVGGFFQRACIEVDARAPEDEGVAGRGRPSGAGNGRHSDQHHRDRDKPDDPLHGLSAPRTTPARLRA